MLDNSFSYRIDCTLSYRMHLTCLLNCLEKAILINVIVSCKWWSSIWKIQLEICFLFFPFACFNGHSETCLMNSLPTILSFCAAFLYWFEYRVFLLIWYLGLLIIVGENCKIAKIRYISFVCFLTTFYFKLYFYKCTDFALNRMALAFTYLL